MKLLIVVTEYHTHVIKLLVVITEHQKHGVGANLLAETPAAAVFRKKSQKIASQKFTMKEELCHFL